MPRRKLSPQLKEDREKFKKSVRKILIESAQLAVDEFEDNFRRGGFMDRRLRKWKPRKGNTDPGRGVLIGKGTGSKLSRSISRGRTSATRTIVGIKGNAKKYASVHNFGLMSGRKKAPFKMPKRKFMGESRALNKKISRLIQKRIKKIL